MKFDMRDVQTADLVSLGQSVAKTAGKRLWRWPREADGEALHTMECLGVCIANEPHANHFPKTLSWLEDKRVLESEDGLMVRWQKYRKVGSDRAEAELRDYVTKQPPSHRRTGYAPHTQSGYSKRWWKEWIMDNDWWIDLIDWLPWLSDRMTFQG